MDIPFTYIFGTLYILIYLARKIIPDVERKFTRRKTNKRIARISLIKMKNLLITISIDVFAFESLFRFIKYKSS